MTSNQPLRSTTHVGTVDYLGGLHGLIETLPRVGCTVGVSMRIGVLADRRAAVLMVGGQYAGLAADTIDEMIEQLTAAKAVLAQGPIESIDDTVTRDPSEVETLGMTPVEAARHRARALAAQRSVEAVQ